MRKRQTKTHNEVPKKHPSMTYLFGDFFLSPRRPVAKAQLIGKFMLIKESLDGLIFMFRVMSSCA